MTYQEFLTYLFDREQTKELAVELAFVIDEQLVMSSSARCSSPEPGAPARRGSAVRRSGRERSRDRRRRAAGLVPDPWRQASWRWWDGARWTAYTDQWFAAPATATATSHRCGPAGSRSSASSSGSRVSTRHRRRPARSSGYETTDPAFLLGSTLGLWIGLGGSCVVAVRRKGTGSLRDLGLVPAPLGRRRRSARLRRSPASSASSIIAAALEAIDKDLLPGGRSDLGEPIDHGGVARDHRRLPDRGRRRAVLRGAVLPRPGAGHAHRPVGRRASGSWCRRCSSGSCTSTRRPAGATSGLRDHHERRHRPRR